MISYNKVSFLWSNNDVRMDNLLSLYFAKIYTLLHEFLVTPLVTLKADACVAEM